MKLEEVLPAYRDGKIISSGDDIYQIDRVDGHKRLTAALESELLGEWTIKEEPKPKVKMWLALYRSIDNFWHVTGTLFESQKHAVKSLAYKKVIWPAIPGADGSYEIEQGE
jgi:hypothetical protein